MNRLNEDSYRNLSDHNIYCVQWRFIRANSADVDAPIINSLNTVWGLPGISKGGGGGSKRGSNKPLLDRFVAMVY
jgi:hypothetical protein